MSRKEKLIQKLLNKSGTFTYPDLKSLLGKFGYEEEGSGKTSGSRVAFVNAHSNHIIRLHKPHPGNELKAYQRKQIITELKNEDLL